VALNANIDHTPLDDAEEDDLALGPAEGEDIGGGGDEHDGGDGHQGGNNRDGGDGRDGSDVQDGPTAGAASSVSGSSARGVPMAIATSMTSPIVQAILPQARVDSPYLAALARYHVTKIAAAVVHSITTAATDAGASSRFSKLVGEAANAISVGSKHAPSATLLLNALAAFAAGDAYQNPVRRLRIPPKSATAWYRVLSDAFHELALSVSRSELLMSVLSAYVAGPILTVVGAIDASAGCFAGRLCALLTACSDHATDADNAVAVQKFMDAVLRPESGSQFRGGGQHDAQEALNWILEALHSSTRIHRRPPPAVFSVEEDEDEEKFESSWVSWNNPLCKPSSRGSMRRRFGVGDAPAGHGDGYQRCFRVLLRGRPGAGPAVLVCPTGCSGNAPAHFRLFVPRCD
jgi:hypothetical protein